MWNPEKIVMRGFMSHMDTTYDFRHGKCVMIFGENKTDDGADSNGSGKSVLLEAITLALTHEVSRDVDRTEYINDDCDETFIGFYLNNPTGEIRQLGIEKVIHRTKSAKIKIFENGEHNKEITSVNEANARIYELIGLTKYDLLNFFILGQDKKFSFLTVGDSEKKDIISRFSNTEHLLQKGEFLKQINKGIESEMDEIEDRQTRLEERIELLTEQLTEDGDFEEQKASKIRTLERTITRIEGEIEAKKISIGILVDNEEYFADKIDNSDDYITKIDSYKQRIKSIGKKISIKDGEINEIDVYVKHLGHLQEGRIDCPKCKFSFIIDEDISLEDIPDTLNTLAESRLILEEEISELTSKRKKIVKYKTKAEASQEEFEEWVSEKKKLTNKLKISNSSLLDLKDELKVNRTKLSEVSRSKPEKLNTKDKKAKISVYKAELKEIKALYDERRAAYEDNGYWVHHFSKKGFVGFLTNKSIKSIEGITNSYLSQINTNLQLQIDGFTQLKGGGVNDRISVSILRNGKLVGSYGRYSGGEKGRINISNIVGLQKLINMSCPNGGLNFLGLDEVFEGLDVTGQKEVVKILEDLGITTLVVSHRSKPIGVENELIIKKINGVSKILN